MNANNYIPYISLGLSIIFWILSCIQTNQSRKVLNDIKDSMLSWQAELNKASIDIMTSDPNIIAKQSSFEESKSKNDSLSELIKIIKELSSSPYTTPEEANLRKGIIETLSRHHCKLITTKEKLLHDAAMSSMSK